MVELTQKNKAAVIVGMVRAFESSGYPVHFSDDDKVSWRKANNWAVQMLGEGVFNPLHAYEVVSLFDREFSEL